jgi:cysteine synthase
MSPRRTLSPEREELYSKLKARIGGSPLIKYGGNVPNGNKVFIKPECFREFNPWQSHYDRVYLELFRYYEERGKLQVGGGVVESTSGSAGRSCAGVGRLLGFDVTIIMPAGTENAREEAIRKEGANIIFTPENDYVVALPARMKQFLLENPDVVCLNHMQGPYGTENKIVTKCFAPIAEEIIKDLHLEGLRLDYFVPAIGNGSTILGPGRIFKSPGSSVKIFGVESFQSGNAHEMRHPGVYKRKFGIDIGSLPRHRIFGTSFPGIETPHLRIAVREGILDDVCLVSDREVGANYLRATGRPVPKEIPRWDDIQVQPFGRSTRAAVAAIVHKLALDVHDQNFAVIGYDLANEHYDS